MADWTDESTMLLDVNDPARSKDQIAKGENVLALAEGAAGAPDILEAALSAALQTKINDGANAARLNAPTAGTTTQQKIMGDDNLSSIVAGVPEAGTDVRFGFPALATVMTAGDITFESAVTLDLLAPTDVVQVTRKVYVNDVAVVTHNYSIDATSTTETDNIAVIQGDLIYSTIAVAVTSGTITSFTSANNIKTGNDVLGVV